MRKCAHVEKTGTWSYFIDNFPHEPNFLKCEKIFRGYSVHCAFSTEKKQSLLPGNKHRQCSSTNQSCLECPMNRLFEVNESAFLLWWNLLTKIPPLWTSTRKWKCFEDNDNSDGTNLVHIKMLKCKSIKSFLNFWTFSVSRR